MKSETLGLIITLGVILGIVILVFLVKMIAECLIPVWRERAEKRRKAKAVDDELPCAEPTPEPDRHIFRPSYTLERLVEFINRHIWYVRSDTTLYVCNVPQLFDPTWLSVNEYLPHRAEMFILLEQDDAAGHTIHRKRLATISVQDTSLISDSVQNVASCVERLERFITDGSATGLEHLLVHLGDGDGWFDKWAGEFEEAAQERDRASIGIGA